MAGQLLGSEPSLTLIGMPSSGKSTVGLIAASLLGYEFTDTDRLIEGRMKMSPKDIFRTHGERYFHRLEREAAIEFSNRGRLLISAGGGIVEAYDAMKFLRMKSVVCYVQRDMSLIDLEGRAMLKGGTAQELYERRKPLYEKYSDFTVTNGDDPETCAREAVRLFKKMI